MAVLTTTSSQPPSTSLSALAASTEAPNEIALILGGRSWTWAELGDRVRRSLTWLARAHPHLQRFAFVPQLDLASISLVLALIESGRTAVLIHPRLTRSERKEMATDLDVTIADDVDDDDDALRCEPAPFRSAITADSEACLAILHTSGTTGRPKGAMLSRRAFLAAADASAQNLGWRPDDRWLLCMPLAHVGGLSILVRSLIARRCVVVPEQVTDRFDPNLIRHVIERDRVTIASFVPTMLKRVLDQCGTQARLPGHLRAILLGGAATQEALLHQAREMRAPILTTYGLTEACSQVTTQTYGTAPSVDQGSGVPMRGTEIRIAERDGRIEVRGPTLMSGYFGPGDPPFLDGGWLRTEDFGRIDPEGRLHVLGRSQDVLVTGGENVYPLEVERSLESIPGIEAACVFGVPDATWGEIVCAALVTRAGVKRDELALAIKTRLATHKRPRNVAFLNELPMTGAGKLDRRATCSAATPSLEPLKT